MFDILKDEWIKTDDGTYGLMGLLENSPRLKRIVGDDPLCEYAIHRFLFVFLMDALQISNIEELATAYDRGSFDMAEIEAYVNRCKAEGVSFDIYDPDRPFLQEKMEGERKTVGYLNIMQPTGTSVPMFVKEYDKDIEMSDSEIARYLLTTTLHYGSGAGNKNSISGTPIYNIVKGENLFKTLMLNLVPINEAGREYGKPYYRDFNPVSAKDVIVEPPLLYGLTCPTRRVMVLDNKTIHFEGQVTAEAPSWRDPYASYRDDKLIKESESLYRKWGDMVTLVTPTKQSPKVVNMASSVLMDEPLRIISYAMYKPDNKVVAMRRYECEIPLGYDEDMCNRLMVLAGHADYVEKELGAVILEIFKGREKKVSNKKKASNKNKNQPKTSLTPYAMQCFHEKCDRAFERRTRDMNFDTGTWLEELMEMALEVFDHFVSTYCGKASEWKEAMKERKNLQLMIREWGEK